MTKLVVKHVSKSCEDVREDFRESIESGPRTRIFLLRKSKAELTPLKCNMRDCDVLLSDSIIECYVLASDSIIKSDVRL